MPDAIDLFEAIHTQRAIRSFRPDPIPDHLITRLLEAAVKAPNGGNVQDWRFIVIRDPGTRRKIGEMYRTGPRSKIGPNWPAQRRRIYTAAQELEDHIEEVPVLILVCTPPYPGEPNPGAMIFPAVQNILLAARGLGLGSVLTVRQSRHEQGLKQLLDIPEDMQTAALLPIGYPAEGARYGPTSRKPVEEVAFDERWGDSWRPQA